MWSFEVNVPIAAIYCAPIKGSCKIHELVFFWMMPNKKMCPEAPLKCTDVKCEFSLLTRLEIVQSKTLKHACYGCQLLSTFCCTDPILWTSLLANVDVG